MGAWLKRATRRRSGAENQTTAPAGVPPRGDPVSGVEEYIVVEKGRLKAVIGGEECLLEEGDAVYFEADVTHRFDNVGAGECSYYLVIVSKDT